MNLARNLKENENGKAQFLRKSRLLTNFLFWLLAFFFVILIGLRNSNFISDGDSYILHSEYDVNFLDPVFLTYPIYWLLVKIFGSYFSDQFPSFLSILVSLSFVFSASKLRGGYRILFIALCILNPMIFNVSQVALRNGLAIGLVLLGISRERTIFFLLAPLFHPGVAPIVLFCFLMLKSHLSGARILCLVALAAIGGAYFESLSDTLLVARGYEAEEAAGQEGLVAYLLFAALAFLYWKALGNVAEKIRWFLPIFFVIWVVVGLQYSFAWRMFAQSLPIALFLLLKGANGNGVLRKDVWQKNIFQTFFLCYFSILSFYFAYRWHPLSEYSKGWSEYWFGFF